MYRLWIVNCILYLYCMYRLYIICMFDIKFVFNLNLFVYCIHLNSSSTSPQQPLCLSIGNPSTSLQPLLHTISIGNHSVVSWIVFNHAVFGLIAWKNKSPLFPPLIFNLLCYCSLVFIFLWKKTPLPLIFFFSSTLRPSTFRWRFHSPCSLWNKWVFPFSFVEQLDLDLPPKLKSLHVHHSSRWICKFQLSFFPSTFHCLLDSHLPSGFLFPLIWTLATPSLLSFCAYGMFE